MDLLKLPQLYCVSTQVIALIMLQQLCCLTHLSQSCVDHSSNTELYSIHIKLEITCLLEFPNYDKCNQDILKFNKTEGGENFNIPSTLNSK